MPVSEEEFQNRFEEFLAQVQWGSGPLAQQHARAMQVIFRLVNDVLHPPATSNPGATHDPH